MGARVPDLDPAKGVFNHCFFHPFLLGCMHPCGSCNTSTMQFSESCGCMQHSCGATPVLLFDHLSCGKAEQANTQHNCSTDAILQCSVKIGPTLELLRTVRT